MFPIFTHAVVQLEKGRPTVFKFSKILPNSFQDTFSKRSAVPAPPPAAGRQHELGLLSQTGRKFNSVSTEFINKNRE
jgi:hypothetical protein